MTTAWWVLVWLLCVLGGSFIGIALINVFSFLIESWRYHSVGEEIVNFVCDLWEMIIYRFGPEDIVISTAGDFEGRAYVEWCDLRTTCVWHVPTQKHLFVRTKDLQKLKLR